MEIGINLSDNCVNAVVIRCGGNGQRQQKWSALRRHHSESDYLLGYHYISQRTFDVY